MTRLIAHRGLSSTYPENSLEAIEAALKHVNVVEIDVRCTHDARAVCAHDASLQRTHGIERRIGELTGEEHRTLEPPLTTLADALDLIADHDAAVMLDVKVARPRAIEAILATVDASRISWNDGRQLRRGEQLDPQTATFQSADAQMLQAIRSRTGAGCLELVPGGSSARELMIGAPFITAYAQAVTIPDALATRAMLRALRAVRLGSYVYTINSQARVDELVRAKASGVYSDKVDVVHTAQ